MDEESSEDEYVPLRKRRQMKDENIRVKRRKITQKIEEEEEQKKVEKKKKVPQKKSLMDIYSERVKAGKVGNDQKKLEKALDEGWVDTKQAFKTAEEIAEGKDFGSKPMTSSWKAPKKYALMKPETFDKLRERFNIETDGDNCPPLMTKFQDMKFPNGIIQALASDKIKVPTPIQMQALPAVLSGRDVIGIAYTGSGKTLVFALPMIMFAMEDECKLPYLSKEGPFGLIICPSRELAEQTYDTIVKICQYLQQDGFPELRSLLCIGGINFREQSHVLNAGMHMVVATPGRLKHSLDSGKFNLNLLKYFCLDEADRLMDTGFDDDMRHVLSYLDHQTQKVFFSATMPRNVRALAEKSMVKPLTIHVGRAGAANLDVIQEVEYVKDSAKTLYLLECLKKTAPPVLIFASNQGDVDDVLEYLLIKGVMARAIHGNKDQTDRKEAIREFKAQRIDVLVATDVASKGLDFPDIKHVVNFDMPPEIEDYIHRIGRTGRCGKTGVATTFINVGVPETTLLDLKGLLLEARQAIPPFFDAINKGHVVPGTACTVCGGLGHSVTDCPKLKKATAKARSGEVNDDFLLNRY